MHWLDTALLILLAIGTGLGFRSGLLWQLARVLSVGVALYATHLLNEQATTLVREYLLQGADPKVAQGSAYILVFLSVYLLLLLLAHLLQRMLHATGFSWMDRFLGAGMGASKTAALLAGLCLVLSRLPNPLVQEQMSHSTLAPALGRGLETSLALIPEDFKRDLADHLNRLKSSAED